MGSFHSMRNKMDLNTTRPPTAALRTLSFRSLISCPANQTLLFLESSESFKQRLRWLNAVLYSSLEIKVLEKLVMWERGSSATLNLFTIKVDVIRKEFFRRASHCLALHLSFREKQRSYWLRQVLTSAVELLAMEMISSKTPVKSRQASKTSSSDGLITLARKSLPSSYDTWCQSAN